MKHLSNNATGKKVTFESLGLSEADVSQFEEIAEAAEAVLGGHAHQLPFLDQTPPPTGDRRASARSARSGRSSRSYSVPRTATPVPPSGLPLAMEEVPDSDMLMMDTGIASEVDEEEEDEVEVGPVIGGSLLDLANAPPLAEQTGDKDAMMDVGSNGEKRKATPPDLLTLSNMYFERNQRTLSKEEARPQSVANSLGGRNVESAASTRSAPAAFPMTDVAIDRHNLGLLRPRKLTPLSRMPRLEESRPKNENGLHRPLHLSVNYTGNNQGISWNSKPTLNPIAAAQHDARRMQRRATYTVTPASAASTASNSIALTSDSMSTD